MTTQPTQSFQQIIFLKSFIKKHTSNEDTLLFQALLKFRVCNNIRSPTLEQGNRNHLVSGNLIFGFSLDFSVLLRCCFPLVNSMNCC